MPNTYQNPVLDLNFADPFVLKVGQEYHAYATNSPLQHVQHAVSADLVHWQVTEGALPTLPSWARAGWTWAPEVIEHQGKFLMYYTVRHHESDLQVVSVAVSDRPEGPFEDTSDQPLVAQFELGGSIDTSPFKAPDGQLYLYWKNDGNHIGVQTTIYGQALSEDGRSLVGEPTPLLINDQPWEGPLIEAPTLYHQDGIYHMLFSANTFDSDLYGVGHAVGPTPLGPFVKADSNPFLQSRGEVAGPGHQCLTFDGAGQPWLVYHAWTRGFVGDHVGKRTVHIDPIRFRDGKVEFAGPTRDLQPAPVLG